MPSAIAARLTACIDRAERPERVAVLGTLWVAAAVGSLTLGLRELLARAVALGFWHVAFAPVVAAGAAASLLAE